jgi:16S rRNA G966 N2-methylase RsmD
VLKEEIELLARKEVQEFIREHEFENAHELLLKNKSLFGLPFRWIADQIIARRKISTKIPLLYRSSGIVYPPSLNLEQSSSEATAQLKAEIVQKELSIKISNVADLTGGFGIDSLFLTKVVESLNFVEPNEGLLNLAKHNFQVLQRKNSTFYHSSAENFLRSANTNFDLIYIDPSRRDTGSRKVFRLQDCTPSIPEIHPLLFNHSAFVLIKTSPLLDLTQGIKEIPFVKKVFIVSADNECKELLFLCEKNFNSVAQIETINLQKDKRQTFSFDWGEEYLATADYGSPLKFLYEANPSVLKSGCFKLISEKFKLKKIHPNTHLYTSAELVKGFPGRIFKIENEKPDFKKVLPDQKANVITRNYPLKPEELRKKLKINDGGEKFVIAFSGSDQKYTILASKVE